MRSSIIKSSGLTCVRLYDKPDYFGSTTLRSEICRERLAIVLQQARSQNFVMGGGFYIVDKLSRVLYT